ncbi:alpha/beta hydrolase family protein [Rheinheimera maricola]|uniref:Prolyl oligopeptidase family serine peptidase n=1 Tax=Rheinheimera maricola TaxID=2793282 RepID=A0ABS7X5S5_9GAMM|nr:prolyl oligopeptidase family serine peptidase [Rheinheimera maricola]MBZ9610529.1 prolyl oligopeptidase family serine peptidase [Rheinheimera maricola]
MQFFKSLVCAVVLITGCAQAAEPDMVAEFSKDATYSDVKLSPDGKFLSVVVSLNGKKALGFVDRSSYNMVNAIQFGGEYEVGDYHWVNDERVVIKMVASLPWSKEPAYYGELYAVNWNGRMGSMIYGYSAAEQQTGKLIKQREATQGWAEIVDLYTKDDRKIVISSTPWGQDGNRVPELLLMDVYSGKTRKIAHGPAAYSNFLVDDDGEPVLAFGVDKHNDRVVFRYNQKDEDWTEVPKQKFGNDFRPIGLNDTKDGVYVFDDFQQDKMGLFELKLADFAYTEVFTDAKVDISSFEATKEGNNVFAFKLEDGNPSYALFTEKYAEAKLFKELLTIFPGEALHITSKTDDDKLWVVYSYSDTNPGTYYLYDAEKKSIGQLFSTRPYLADVKLANTKPISFTSFDDTVIHGYFTAGKNQTEHKPLIVNVHGGPHGVRDHWGYDGEVQLLANAGYSVLQVNFRGSGGYGNSLLRAGYLQWGDAIQRDIIAATEWAIASGMAKAGNVCIMGASFGGYAALQSASLAPDLFKCTVGVAGVYDLNIMKSDGDIPLKSFGISYLDQVLGSDQAQLDAYSPVNQVAKLKAAVLIAHGKRDKRAPLEHALRLKKALDNAGKPYQWLEFNDETHGFYSPQNREVYYRKLLEFLQTHLKN